MVRAALCRGPLGTETGKGWEEAPMGGRGDLGRKAVPGSARPVVVSPACG